jgi:phage terminase large subunit-like protein
MIYVSKVLKAYESYKNSVCFGVREKITKLEEENKPPMSKEERLKNFTELLKDAKMTVNNGEFFEDYGEVVYNFIRHNKLIKIDKVLIDKAMQSGEEEFRSYVSDSKRGNLKKIINDVSFTATKKEEMVRRYARRYVAQFWVGNMDLEDMLKKLTYEMLLY